MSPSFAAAAVAPILREEWTVGLLELPVPHGRRPARVRRRSDRPRGDRRARRDPRATPVRRRGHRRRGRQPRVRARRDGPGVGGPVPVPHRRGARRRLPGRDEARRRLVPARPRPGDRGRQRRADGRRRPCRSCSGRSARTRASTGDRSSWRRASRRSSVRCSSGLAARAGPLDVAAPRFSPAIAAAAFREPSVRLASIGYFGHMWELFAMWTWIPIFLIASFAAAGVTDPAARLADGVRRRRRRAASARRSRARIADRVGRTTTTIVALATSGTSAIVAGILFGAPIPVIVLVAAHLGRVGRGRLGPVLVSRVRARPARDGRLGAVGPDRRRFHADERHDPGRRPARSERRRRLAAGMARARARPGRRDRRDVPAPRPAGRHQDGERAQVTGVGHAWGGTLEPEACT